MSEHIERRNTEVVQEVTIAPKGYLGLTIKKGQILRLIDVEGQQVADVIVFNLNDLEEVSSGSITVLFNKTRSITKGHYIFSQKGNKLLTIIEDTLGARGSTLTFPVGFCNDDLNYARYGIRGTANCRDNLCATIAPYGLTKKDINYDCVFCPFMNMTEPGGVWGIYEPLSRAGDYMDFQAEMDCLVAISNCPQEHNPCNAFNLTPLKVVVYETPSEVKRNQG